MNHILSYLHTFSRNIAIFLWTFIFGCIFSYLRVIYLFFSTEVLLNEFTVCRLAVSTIRANVYFIVHFICFSEKMCFPKSTSNKLQLDFI